MIQKGIYAVFWLLILLWQSFCKLPQNWIYSPQYSNIVYATDTQSFFSKINVSTNSGLIFISAGVQGVKVLDPEQEFSVVYSFNSTENIMGYAVTKDSNYLFFSYNGKLTIFDYSNRKQFVQVGQDSQNVYVMDVLINNTEDLLFIFSISGQVRILNISNKLAPTLAGIIQSYDEQIYGSFISKDSKWLALSQDNQGLSIYKLTQSGGTVNAVLAGTYTQTSSHQTIISPDEKYIYSIDNRNGVSIGDFTVLTLAQSNTYSLTLTYFLKNWWPTNVVVPSPASLCLSNDGNFLFLGVRSKGIYTVDLTIKSAPINYMWSYFPFHGNSIALSPDTNYLYFSNSKSFMAFRKLSPILGLKYVNMYNRHLSAGFDESNTTYYWRCDVDTARNMYIGAFHSDGYWLIDVSDQQNFNVIKSSQFPVGQNSPVDTFFIKNDYKIMLVPINDGINFFAVLDISDYNSITEIQRIPYGEPFNGYVKDQDNNSDDTLIACALDKNVVFVETKVIRNYKVVAKWRFLPSMKGFLTGIMISQDNKYAIGACRGYGYFILDIQDLSNIKLANYLVSTGSEQVYKSLYYSTLYYLVDGLQGLFLMDQTKLPQFSQISQVFMEGWTNDITFLSEEKTIIISTMQEGMVYLVDISNQKAPFVVSNYLFGQQNGMFTCIKQDFSTLFINNNLQVRSLPINSKVYIHSDYLEVQGYKESGDMKYKIIQNPDIFYVGQTIKINVCFLYQTLDLAVNKVYLYQNQKQFDLPYWIKYDPVEISIEIQILKDAVDPHNLNYPLLNILVFKTQNPLLNTDFVFTKGNCKTDETKATAIYKYLQTQGLIDSSKLVNPDLTFNDLQDIYINDRSNLFPPDNLDYNKCLSKLLKFTLLNSIQYTPIYLKISPSLTLDLSGTSDNYISTKANETIISIYIQKFSGYLIFDNQQSVNIQINDDKNNLTVAGSVENVNQFLNQKIIIFPLNSNVFQNIQAVVTVSDKMNFPILMEHPSPYFPFLMEKQNIKINPDLKLSDQFKEDIEIITNFSFSFDENTFIVPDFKTEVKYSVHIEKNGEFIPIDDSGWLQYNSNLRKLYGSPPQSAFQSVVKVQVTGTDGYTKISDAFMIHITKLPIMFVAQWIGLILGPLTGAFGLYKYRDVFYNIQFKKRNGYASIICKPNELFMLKIPLITHQQVSAIQILNQLTKKLLSKKTKSIQRISIGNQESVTKQQFSEKKSQIRIDRQPKRFHTIKRLQSKLMENIGKLKNAILNDITTVASVYKKRIQFFPSSNRSSPLEKLFLMENGMLDMNQFTKEIIELDIQFKIKNINTSTKVYKEELNHEKSTLRECLKYQLVRKLISSDEKSLSVYNFLKYYSESQSPQLTKNDWYKYLVNIQKNDELDLCEGIPIIFPSFQLNYKNFFEGLELLDLFKVKDLKEIKFQDINEFIKDQLFTDVSNTNVNLYLVELALFADAAGIQDKLPSSFFPCCGESIHIEPYQIKTVVAFKYSPGGYCFSLQKYLGLDYKPYGPQGNMQLPSWLQLEMEPGVILIKGTPEFQNVEDVIIRIYTIEGYIIRYFTLKVKEDKNELQKLRELAISRKSVAKQEVFQSKQKSKFSLTEDQIDQIDSIEYSPNDMQTPTHFDLNKGFKQSTFSQQNMSHSPQALIKSQEKIEEDFINEQEKQDF